MWDTGVKCGDLQAHGRRRGLTCTGGGGRVVPLPPPTPHRPWRADAHAIHPHLRVPVEGLRHPVRPCLPPLTYAMCTSTPCQGGSPSLSRRRGGASILSASVALRGAWMGQSSQAAGATTASSSGAQTRGQGRVQYRFVHRGGIMGSAFAGGSVNLSFSSSVIAPPSPSSPLLVNSGGVGGWGLYAGFRQC